MKDFDWEGFREGKFRVYCNSNKIIKNFLNSCREQGIRWVGEEEITTVELFDKQEGYFLIHNGGLCWSQNVEPSTKVVDWDDYKNQKGSKIDFLKEQICECADKILEILEVGYYQNKLENGLGEFALGQIRGYLFMKNELENRLSYEIEEGQYEEEEN